MKPSLSLLLLGAAGALACHGQAASRGLTPPDAGAASTLSVPDASGAELSAPRAVDPHADALCGSRGEPCCTDSRVPCGVQLSCDVATRTCILPPAAGAAQLCAREEDCAAGQRCCASGLLGTCQALAARQECPLPDLALYPAYGPRVGELSPLGTAYAAYGYTPGNYDCAQEKKCLGGPGARRVLRVGFLVANVGQADLILGTPGATPGVERAACDGAPYIEDYVRFELLDAARAVVVRGEGPIPASCGSVGSGPARFDCDFLGLPRGVSETYDNSWADCQWIDITDTPAGDYTLRVRINPERVLPEASYANNSIELPVALPSFNPLAACVPLDDEIRSGFQEDVWCDWSLPEARQGLRCTPGEPLRLSCAGCTSDTMLRVCEGARTCSASQAWAFSSGSLTDSCPLAEFSCPPSGVYSVLSHGGIFGGPTECELRSLDAPDAGAAP